MPKFYGDRGGGLVREAGGLVGEVDCFVGEVGGVMMLRLSS